MKRLVLFVIIFTLFITRSYWLHAGIPYTHDGENHLARFANFKVALKEGQFPPRFAPNLLNHYGYPVFNYNYPLANILSVPFSLLKVHYELTFKLLIFFSLLMGSFGVIHWLKYYSKNKLPILAALIVYLSGPPLVSALLFRGSIGEIMAYALWPWLFASMNAAIKKLTTKQLLAYSAIWTAFLLSHNISVFIAAIVFAVYGIWQLFTTKARKQFVAQIAVILITAVGLSLWFWLPAIFEMKAVIVSQAANQREYLLHFPTVQQLLYSPLNFGYSYPGPVDTLSFWLGWIVPLTLLTVIALGISMICSKPLSAHKIPNYWMATPLPIVGILLLATIYMQLAFSTRLWQLIPYFRLIQFPWRFGMLATLFSLPLLVWLLQYKTKLFNRITWVVIVTQVLIVGMAQPIDYIHKQKYEYDLHGGTTSTQNENLTPTFKYLLIADWQPAPTIFSGSAFISNVENWNGSYRKYRLDVASPSIITEPTMNFLGWETRVRTVNSNDQTFKLVPYLNSDEIQGRIAYALEPGVYQVITRFTQNTLARHLGNLSFVFTLGIIATLLVWRKYRL